MDEFGLPLLPISFVAPKARHDAVADIIRCTAGRLFSTAVRHMGEAQAKALWNQVAEGKSGPKGSRDPVGDRLLLDVYDHVLKLGTVPSRQIPRHLGERLATKKGQKRGRFGASAGAIEKRVRRLVNRRAAAAAKPSAGMLAARAAVGASASILAIETDRNFGGD